MEQKVEMGLFERFKVGSGTLWWDSLTDEGENSRCNQKDIQSTPRESSSWKLPLEVETCDSKEGFSHRKLLNINLRYQTWPKFFP